MGWLRDEQNELAVERILDAAAALFLEHGVPAVGMGDVAKAAGCSRATLYRYFDNRDALRIAYIHREARRIGHEVAVEVAGITDPAEQLVEAMLGALRRVRHAPTLAAWFEPGGSGIAIDLAQSSAVSESLIASFLGDAADPDVLRRARWIVRIMLSFLAVPGAGEADERAQLEQFVVPVTAEVAAQPRHAPGLAPRADRLV